MQTAAAAPRRQFFCTTLMAAGTTETETSRRSTGRELREPRGTGVGVLMGGSHGLSLWGAHMGWGGAWHPAPLPPHGIHHPHPNIPLHSIQHPIPAPTHSIQHPTPLLPHSTQHPAPLPLPLPTDRSSTAAPWAPTASATPLPSGSARPSTLRPK